MVGRICPKCHRHRSRHVFNHHVKTCIPFWKDIEQYLKSKSSATKQEKT